MRFPDPPAATHDTDDPFAEFDPEQVASDAPPETRDWFAEFPDEQAPSPPERSKTWRRLSDSLKD